MGSWVVEGAVEVAEGGEEESDIHTLFTLYPLLHFGRRVLRIFLRPGFLSLYLCLCIGFWGG